MGEYYWNGQCAAAGTAAANKFRLTATDGANVAAGDHVLITSGYGGAGTYNYYVFTTVSSVSSIGSNVYEVTLTDSLDSGNIGTTEYYTIVKTEITGSLSIYSKTSLYGLYISGSSVRGVIYISGCTIETLNYVFAIGDTVCCNVLNATVDNIYNCYFYNSYIARPALWIQSSNVTASGSLSVASTSVYHSLAATSFPGGISVVGGGYIDLRGAILRGASSSTGAGISLTRGAGCLLINLTIVPATGTGISTSYNSFAQLSGIINNHATTPKNPASSTDGSYIGGA
jgi:hypothetical protein